MTVIEIHYEAKCKQCKECYTLRRKTFCAYGLESKNYYDILKKGKPIRQNDKACKHFKL